MFIGMKWRRPLCCMYVHWDKVEEGHCVVCMQGFIQDFFVGGGGGGGGGNFFFIAGETMWLIEHSEGEGVGGGCAPSHAACSTETYCLILFLIVRFTLWTDKGNAIMSATGTKKSAGGGGGGGNFFWVGKIPGPPPLCMKPWYGHWDEVEEGHCVVCMFIGGRLLISKCVSLTVHEIAPACKYLQV